MKRLMAFLVVTALALVTAVSVFAVPPVEESASFDVHYPAISCDDVGDGDFWIWDHVVGSYSRKSFFNRDGDLIRSAVHAGGVENLYVPSNPDKEASGKFNYNWVEYYDPETGEITESLIIGNYWNIQLPHEGNFIHVVGIVTFDEDGNMVQLAGLDDADFAAVCEYFAP